MIYDLPQKNLAIVKMRGEKIT